MGRSHRLGVGIFNFIESQGLADVNTSKTCRRFGCTSWGMDVQNLKLSIPIALVLGEGEGEGEGGTRNIMVQLDHTYFKIKLWWIGNFSKST